ncbi:MAG: hypothetical protein WAN36_10560 [Calditrichia bacterium]
MKVLVYETSKDRAKLIEDLLGSYRYKIFMHHDNHASINQVLDIKPSLIIMNANHREHVEMLEKLKKHSRLSKIPVILISNLDHSEIINQLSDLPNVDCLTEPIKIKNFRHVIERWVNFRSLYLN